jgi:catecholate siderophore receptor
MKNNDLYRPAVMGMTSLAAAMFATGAAHAADAADAADAGPAEILVVGRGEKVDLATMRGPVIDVPQTINVIDGEVIKDRQITTLSDALRNVAGVTTSVGEGGVVSGDQFFIRGQSAKDDIFTDGLRDFGAFTRDAFNYESVQVLKGSSSTALGRGVSGGAINTQSKRAETTDAFGASMSAGTDAYFRATVDANKAINDTTGFRINAMFHRNDTPDRDNVFSHRWGVAPALSFGKGTDTSVDLIFFHQEENKTVDYGVPIAVTSSTTDIERPVTEYGVPRSNFYGFAGDEDNTIVNTLTVRFAHKANDWLSFTSDTKLGAYKRRFRQTVPSCAAACGDALLDGNPATVPMMAAGVRGQFRQTTRGIQNVSTALIEKPIAGMRNELIIGWDISYQTNDREDDIRPDNGATSSVSQSLFAPGATAPAFTHKVFQYRDSSATDYSFFIDERLWLTPKLSINAGVRYQHFKATQDQTALTTNANAANTTCNGVPATGTCFSRSSSTNNLWNPKASIIWEASEKMSFYTSFSKAAVPPGNSVSNGSLATPTAIITANALQPEKTETFDLGAKFSLFGDRLLIQSAIYQINRSNAKDLDPNTQLLVASSEPKQRLRGFELGASGTITPDLLITANYTYVDAEIRDAYTSSTTNVLINGVTTSVTSFVRDTASIGNQVRYVPSHAASLWTSYKPLEGSLKGLEIGVGANYQSKVYVNNANTQVAPAYASFDALLGYNFGKYRIAVNGYNLGDKLYYAQVNGGRVVPSAGRSVLVTFSGNF